MIRRILHKILTFEFNDAPRCPRFIRESILLVLGRSIRDAGVYEQLVPHFSRLCGAAKVTAILELGAGSGESSAVFVDALLRAGQTPPRIYISDLYPMPGVMAETCKRYPDILIPVAKGVDLAAVDAVPPHDMRMVLSAFHHLEPDLVRAFLDDARRQGCAVFIAEPFTNSLKAFFPLFIHGFTSLARNGLWARRMRCATFFFTFLVPLIPLCLLWDGLISMIRMYDGRQLMEITQALPEEDGGYHWQYLEVDVALGGTASVFMGQPCHRDSPSG